MRRTIISQPLKQSCGHICTIQYVGDWSSVQLEKHGLDLGHRGDSQMRVPTRGSGAAESEPSS